jgi:enterochelin esterase family protein
MAPNASEVLLFGDWPGGMKQPLTKDDQGVWSITVGPLTPELWGYSFTVDGVQALDPRNGNTKRDGTRLANILLISGPESELYEVKDVPHGTVSMVWYDSPSLKMKRRMYVYTPPDYATTTARYPVFYLLHGGGGDEEAWTTLGRAPEIMDNLIAQGKVRPMIVVMPNENSNQIAAPSVVAPLPTGVAGNPMQGTAMLDFPKSIVTDLIPFIDKAYRTLTDRGNRAIAGLSMGGGMTLLAAFNNLDTFAWVGTFSAGLPPMPGVAVKIPPPTNAASLRGPDITNTIDKAKLAALLPQLTADANARLRLFYVGIGVQDGLITAHTAFKELLQEKGVKATIVEKPGYGHEWAFWRVSLQDLAPRLFQPTAK